MSDYELDSNLVALLHQKSQEDPERTMHQVSTYIKQLNQHIDGVISLSATDIEKKLDYLIGCTTITLDLPVNDLEFLRARPSEETPFSHTDELSYIRSNLCSDNFPPMGRLNRAGKALFYAALKVRQSDEALGVVLSEAGARNLDQFSVLHSSQKEGTALNLRMLGIWDDVRRGSKPYYLETSTFKSYQLAHEIMRKVLPPLLFRAYQLTDRFLADMMSRKGSDRLYEVTSIAGSMMLESQKADGILYSSVQAKGEPVVALLPSAVDDKLQHDKATEVNVHQHLGYEFYHASTVRLGRVDSSTGDISW